MKKRFIYIGIIVLALLPMAASCDKEEGSTTSVGIPTPIQRSTEFTVSGDSTHTTNIKPPWDTARVEGTIKSNLSINFGVRDPQFMALSAYLAVTATDFSFVTTSRDTYHLYFDNSQQEEPRRVSLSYTIYPLLAP